MAKNKIFSEDEIDMVMIGVPAELYNKTGLPDSRFIRMTVIDDVLMIAPVYDDEFDDDDDDDICDGDCVNCVCRRSCREG